WGMARVLTPDVRRALIAVGALVIVVAVGGALAQIAAIVLGAVAGLVFCRTTVAEPPSALQFPVTKRAGAIALSLLAAMLVALPILSATLRAPVVLVLDAFTRAGALV